MQTLLICRILRQLTWVLTISKNTCLGVCSLQRVNYGFYIWTEYSVNPDMSGKLKVIILFLYQNICLNWWVRKQLQFYALTFCSTVNWAYEVAHTLFTCILYHYSNSKVTLSCCLRKHTPKQTILAYFFYSIGFRVVMVHHWPMQVRLSWLYKVVAISLMVHYILADISPQDQLQVIWRFIEFIWMYT